MVDFDSLPRNADKFRGVVSKSLERFKSEGFEKAIWLRVPIDFIELVPICIREFGFYIHHSKKEYVMLAKWTNPRRENPVPVPSSHQVGVGAVILRSDGCVLLVKERSGPAAVSRIWKLPTGLADPSEDISVAAVREAKEETGLDCMCFRLFVPLA